MHRSSFSKLFLLPFLVVLTFAVFGSNFASAAELTNISTRGLVLTGDNVMIGGFIIEGTTPKTVLIRARGPSMGTAPFNVPGTLANPFLQLFSGQTVIASNDNWRDTQQAQIIATGLDPCQSNPGQPFAPPGCDLESAILITLNPGAYTAVVSGVGGGTGVGLIEVFKADAVPTSQLTNISTRGLVLTGDNVMIGGFIVGGTTPKTVLIRARGPSMAAAPFNVPGVLSDPVLQLFSGQTIIAENDDWQFGSQEAQIIATGLDPCQPNPGQPFSPPNCELESAILITLNPGAYTAIVSGFAGATGVGLIEVFEVDDPVTGPDPTVVISSATCTFVAPSGFTFSEYQVSISGSASGPVGSELRFRSNLFARFDDAVSCGSWSNVFGECRQDPGQPATTAFTWTFGFVGDSRPFNYVGANVDLVDSLSHLIAGDFTGMLICN